MCSSRWTSLSPTARTPVATRKCGRVATMAYGAARSARPRRLVRPIILDKIGWTASCVTTTAKRMCPASSQGTIEYPSQKAPFGSCPGIEGRAPMPMPWRFTRRKTRPLVLVTAQPFCMVMNLLAWPTMLHGHASRAAATLCIACLLACLTTWLCASQLLLPDPRHIHHLREEALARHQSEFDKVQAQPTTTSLTTKSPTTNSLRSFHVGVHQRVCPTRRLRCSEAPLVESPWRIVVD